MTIAYNPLKKQDGSNNSALSTAPSYAITFDLPGKTIYARGVEFKGTDTTYNVFKKHTSDSNGGYDGLVPVPDYNGNLKTRFLREDGTWVVPTDTTYSIVNSTTDGLAPKIGTSASATITTQADEWVLTSTKGATPTWRKLPGNAFSNTNNYRPISINGTSILGNNNTALNLVAGTNITLSPKKDSNNKYTGEVTITANAIGIKDLSGTSFSTYLKSSITYGYNSDETKKDNIVGDFGIFNMQTSSYTESEHFYFRQFRGQAGIDKLYTRLYYKRENENIKYTDWKEILKLGDYTTLAGYGITDAVKIVKKSANVSESCVGYTTADHNLQNGGLFTGLSADGLYGSQLLGNYVGTGLYYRGKNNGTWTAWKTVAFTDSNVASATKLKTARKIWGQNFDGTADVSGEMTGVTSIQNYSGLSIISNGLAFAPENAGDLKGALVIGGSVDYGLAIWGEGSGKCYLQSGRTDGKNAAYNLILQHLGGNVGIGTISPTEKLEVSGNIKATSFLGNLDGSYINKLTGYTKATTISAITANDTLNVALGKLEFKTDFIYNDLFGTDNDDIINKWHEIVDFIGSVKEGTDITEEFVTRKTTQTITGAKTFNGTTATILTVDRDSDNPTYIAFKNKGTLKGYLGIDSSENPVYTDTNVNKYKILHAGNYTNYKHSYTNLTGSTIIANQAIVSNGTKDGWTLKTLGSNAFNSNTYLQILGNVNANELKENGVGYITLNGPNDNGPIISFGGTNYHTQIHSDYLGNNLYWRVNKNNELQNWKQIVTTDFGMHYFNSYIIENSNAVYDLNKILGNIGCTLLNTQHINGPNDANLKYGAILLFGSPIDCFGLMIVSYNNPSIYIRGGNLRDNAINVNWDWVNLLHSGNTHINNGIITINGNTITPLTTGYIGTTQILTTSKIQALTGITSLSMSDNINILSGNSDRYITFGYSNNAFTSADAYSWRLGYIGSGENNANYFKIQSSHGNTWTDVLKLGLLTYEATFSGNVIASGNVTASGDLIIKNSGINAATPYLKFQRGSINDSYIDWRLGSTNNGKLILQYNYNDTNATTETWNDVFVTTRTISTFNSALEVTGSYLTLGNSNGSDLIFKRPSANYIWTDEPGGYFVIGVKDTGGTSSANASLLITKEFIQPGIRNNAVYLGNSSYRWANVFSVLGNFSGNVTASKFVTSGGTASQFVKGDGSLDSTSYVTTTTLENYVTKTEFPNLSSKGLYKILTSSSNSNINKWKKFARINLSSDKVYTQCGGYMFIYDHEGHRVKGILDFQVRTIPDTSINNSNINLQSPYLKWHILDNSNYASNIKMVKVENGIFDLYITALQSYTTFVILVFTPISDKITLFDEPWINTLPETVIATSSYTITVPNATTATKLANTLTFSAGAFVTKTYNGSSATTINIPTHTSHLTNNSFAVHNDAVKNVISLTRSTLGYAYNLGANADTFWYTAGPVSVIGVSKYLCAIQADASNNTVIKFRKVVNGTAQENWRTFVNSDGTQIGSSVRPVYVKNDGSVAPFTLSNATANDTRNILVGHDNGIYLVTSTKINPSTGILIANGFVKSGSSSSYVLLGDGGHKAISDFLLKSEIANQELSTNLTTITIKSLAVTTDWMDTGIIGSYKNESNTLVSGDLETGTYIVQVYCSGAKSGGTSKFYNCYWSGVMSWYSGTNSTNSLGEDEILLHRSGHADNNCTIYLRTKLLSGNKGLKLLIAANQAMDGAEYTFKFKRVI